MARLPVLSLIVMLVAASVFAPFQAVAEPMPEALIIGYDEEGKVDATEDACRAFVVEVVEWEKAEVDQAVRDVCAARMRHVDAYGALQASYKKFRATLAGDTRLDLAAAASSAAELLKSCIEHKSAITTGGHNIRIDIIPNEIAAECLDLGRNLLDKETADLGGER
jgi:hypothetical protein